MAMRLCVEIGSKVYLPCLAYFATSALKTHQKLHKLNQTVRFKADDCDKGTCRRRDSDMKLAMKQKNMLYLQPSVLAKRPVTFKESQPLASTGFGPYVDPLVEYRCKIKKDCLDLKTGRKQREERQKMKDELIEKEKAALAQLAKERESGK